MTIAGTQKEITKLIGEHHVYGLETIINSIVYAVDGEEHINEEYIKQLIHQAYAHKAMYDKKYEGRA